MILFYIEKQKNTGFYKSLNNSKKFTLYQGIFCTISCFAPTYSKRQTKSVQDRYFETDSEMFDIADVTTAFEQ